MSDRIRGTYYLTKAGAETTPIRDLIQRRRHQLLIHSCIYYHMNQSLISDAQWDSWARELVELQRKYPKIADRVDYHEAFKGFDGSTGFDLPITNPEIINKAKWIIMNQGRFNYNEKIRVISKRKIRVSFQ